MLNLTADIKHALNDVAIDDEAHWLIGDYGREARNWGHVDVLFQHEMLSLDAEALQKLKQRALTTYHLTLHSETMVRAQEYDTVSKLKLNTANTLVQGVQDHSRDDAADG